METCESYPHVGCVMLGYQNSECKLVILNETFSGNIVSFMNELEEEIDSMPHGPSGATQDGCKCIYCLVAKHDDPATWEDSRGANGN